jgi:Trpc4-associated protein
LAAVVLAEEVLAVREDTLRVQEIPNFTSLVHKFSSRQLASFCRVLAMVVFEPEVELCQFISSLQIESCVLSCQVL